MRTSGGGALGRQANQCAVGVAGEREAMRFRAWAKRKAAKKHPKGDFRYRMTKDTLEIAVVHEDGEWAVWEATVRKHDAGDGR